VTPTQNPPTQGRGAADPLAGDHRYDTTDHESRATDTEVAVGGLLVSALPLQSLAELVEPLLPEMFTAVIPRWVFRSAVACLRGGIIPDPVTVPSVAMVHGIATPPAFRGHVQSSLWSLQDKAPVPALALHYRDLLLGNHCRRVVQRAGERLHAAAWGAGELTDLAAVVTGELTAVAALLAVEVGRNV